MLCNDNIYKFLYMVLKRCRIHYVSMWKYVMCCSWVGLVSKNYEIERACMELEAEVQELEHKAKKLKKWNTPLLSLLWFKMIDPLTIALPLHWDIRSIFISSTDCN